MWLDSQPVNLINTWDELESRFLAKYFILRKTMKLQMEITNFHHLEGESLYEVWERFKFMLHWLQLQTFYNGIDRNLRSSLDGVSVGVFMSKTYVEGFQLIKDVVINFYMWLTERFTYRAKKPIVNAIGSETISNKSFRGGIILTLTPTIQGGEITPTLSGEGTKGDPPSKE
ncbi:Retrotransposon gag protein [Gossypium australe]|uniref:Retrotransposon gag protein n=1 Tax=Gossypium australe TaxID=47621 RepID=A0A5B6WGZ2_9ROSI|nr:Retrotransposon gag protein [Gossypium australe]